MGEKQEAGGYNKEPCVLSSGALLMRVGLIADWNQPSVFMTPAARKLLNVDISDYVQIKDECRSTLVSRKICDITCLSSTGDGYIYVDSYTLHLLDTEINSQVEVSLATHTIDVP
jgi:hypothetical protein